MKKVNRSLGARNNRAMNRAYFAGGHRVAYAGLHYFGRGSRLYKLVKTQWGWMVTYIRPNTGEVMHMVACEMTLNEAIQQAKNDAKKRDEWVASAGKNPEWRMR